MYRGMARNSSKQLFLAVPVPLLGQGALKQLFLLLHGPRALSKVLYQAPCPTWPLLGVRVHGQAPLGTPGHPCTPPYTAATELPYTVHGVVNSGSSMAPGPGRPCIPRKRKCTPAPTSHSTNGVKYNTPLENSAVPLSEQS